MRSRSHPVITNLLHVDHADLPDAIRRLAARLHGTGIELRPARGTLHLAPIAKAPWRSTISSAIAASIDASGLTVTEARFLGRILRGPDVSAKQLALTSASRPSLHRLYNAGLVERPGLDTHPLRLTPAAEGSLRRFVRTKEPESTGPMSGAR